MAKESQSVTTSIPAIVAAPSETALHDSFQQKKSLRERFGWILIVVAALAPSWMLVQAITIFLTREAHGLSWIAFLLTSIFALVWLFYGCFVVEGRDWVIVASSISTLITSTLVLVGIQWYGTIKPVEQKKRLLWSVSSNGTQRNGFLIPSGFQEFNVYLQRGT